MLATCIFERCLDSNPESCRSKQASYGTNLATHLPMRKEKLREKFFSRKGLFDRKKRTVKGKMDKFLTRYLFSEEKPFLEGEKGAF